MIFINIEATKFTLKKSKNFRILILFYLNGIFLCSDTFISAYFMTMSIATVDTVDIVTRLCDCNQKSICGHKFDFGGLFYFNWFSLSEVIWLLLANTRELEKNVVMLLILGCLSNLFLQFELRSFGNCEVKNGIIRSQCNEKRFAAPLETTSKFFNKRKYKTISLCCLKWENLTFEHYSCETHQHLIWLEKRMKEQNKNSVWSIFYVCLRVIFASSKAPDSIVKIKNFLIWKLFHVRISHKRRRTAKISANDILLQLYVEMLRDSDESKESTVKWTLEFKSEVVTQFKYKPNRTIIKLCIDKR